MFEFTHTNVAYHLGASMLILKDRESTIAVPRRYCNLELVPKVLHRVLFFQSDGFHITNGLQGYEDKRENS